MGRGAQREKFEARIQAHVRRFWVKAAEGVDAFLRENRIERLIIGGPEEATGTVRALRPEASRERVVAVVPLPARATLAEIQERTLPVALAEERRREAALVDAVLEELPLGARKWWGGVQLSRRFRRGRCTPSLPTGTSTGRHGSACTVASRRRE